MLHSRVALHTNTRLGWKGLPGTNALAYYGNPLIMAVKNFMIRAPGVNAMKHFLLYPLPLGTSKLECLSLKKKFSRLILLTE